MTFSSLEENSVIPSVPENLPESGSLSATAVLCAVLPLVLLPRLSSSAWCQLAGWARSCPYPQRCSFPLLPDLFWWWLEFHECFIGCPRNLSCITLGKFPILPPPQCRVLGLEMSVCFLETRCHLSSSLQLAEAQCGSLGCQQSP